jgi:hypothetical protein
MFSCVLTVAASSASLQEATYVPGRAWATGQAGLLGWRRHQFSKMAPPEPTIATAPHMASPGLDGRMLHESRTVEVLRR